MSHYALLPEGKIYLPRENLAELSRGKFISGFISPSEKVTLKKITLRFLHGINGIEFHAA